MKLKKRFSTSEKMLLLSLIMIIVIRNFVWFSTYFYMLPAVFLLFVYIQKNGLRLKREQGKFIIPIFLFLLYSAGSILWAANPEYANSKCFIILRIYLVVIIYVLYIKNTEHLQKHIEIFYLTGILMLLYLAACTPLGIWKEALTGSFTAATDEGRLGTTIGYHPNELGHICVIFTFISIYLQGLYKKNIYWIAAAAFIIVTFFTKSRSSLLMLAVMLGMYYILSEERARKQIFALAGVFLAAAAAYWAIFHVTALYDLVGFRFAGLVGSAAEQDASTATRLQFLKYAIELFGEHPILGVGLDNFKYYAYRGLNAWAEVYSHSNWGELLSGTGLIGASIYYIPQFAAIGSLIKSLGILRGKKRKLCAFLLTFLLSNVLFDIQKISYDKLEIIYPTALAVVGAAYLKRMRYTDITITGETDADGYSK